ncbi:class I SAM-dependent methyltransferase [Acidobacteriota bacterium]
MSCPSCNARFKINDDITDFLSHLHPVAARERQAVASLDGEASGASDKLRGLLKKFDVQEPDEGELQEFPCLRHAKETRVQLRQLLAKYPMKPGWIVVELGADHCWTSNLLLDAGCHVIAVDITDHLSLASRAGDPDLCRINADMNALPLAHDSVDIVWATSSAHHSWDLAKTFREAFRILRQGGMLLFCSEPLPSWPRYLFGKRFGQTERALGINEKWIRRGKWLTLCRRAGFRAQLAFPTLRPQAVRERLEAHHLPGALAPFLMPLLKTLQVSIHLIAFKGGGPASKDD